MIDQERADAKQFMRDTDRYTQAVRDEASPQGQ